MLIFDIGSNIGKYTIHNYTDKTKIIAVEASLKTFETLVKNTQHLSNVTCLNYAVCDSDQAFVDFWICQTADTLSTLDKRWLFSDDSRFGNSNFTVGSYKVSVPTVSIDTLIDKYGIPDLIKIDVEGAEELVVKSLTKKVKCLCFEWAAEWKDDICRTIDILSALGFTQFHIQHEDNYDYKPSDYEFSATECKEQINIKIHKVDWGMIWAI
jgi:FkbM family methyltransferase